MDLFGSLQTLISEGLLFFRLDQPLHWSKEGGGGGLAIREGKGSGVTIRKINCILYFNIVWFL